MSFVFIDDPQRVGPLVRALASGEPFALDCEAAGFHRYTDQLCLVQITTADGTDYIVDPITFDVSGILRGPIEDPDVPLYMHGADFDMRLLDRDLGIRPRGLFDTQAAASLLGEPGLGLASLLEKHLDVKLAKKYQRADWARRPLPEDMLDYAAADTRYLHDLVSILRAGLDETDRALWAEEEFRELESIRWEEPEDEDPVTRVKGARDLGPREVAALREALEWRDGIARSLDRAPFRVAHDRILVEIAEQPPSDVQELSRMKGMNGRLAREAGGDLVERLERVRNLPHDDLVGYPPPTRNGPGRPPPEVEERMDRLKRVRNRRAEELGIDRGTLLPNASLLEIARVAPAAEDELVGVPGVKRWQVEAVGRGLLAEMGG